LTRTHEVFVLMTSGNIHNLAQLVVMQSVETLEKTSERAVSKKAPKPMQELKSTPESFWSITGRLRLYLDCTCHLMVEADSEETAGEISFCA
jgi:hypothetical protein